MNWTDTLDARHAGARQGFLAADLPLEDQDLQYGGPRTLNVEAAKELDDMSKAELLDEAARLSIDVPASMTKADLLELLKG